MQLGNKAGLSTLFLTLSFIFPYTTGKISEHIFIHGKIREFSHEKQYNQSTMNV